MQPPKTIAPAELEPLLAGAGDALTLLDVREPHEVSFNRLPGATHIPMNEIPARLEELDSGRRTVVYCHHGMRSYQVAVYLLQQGFADVANLEGGIDHYAMAIDRDLGFY